MAKRKKRGTAKKPKTAKNRQTKKKAARTKNAKPVKPTQAKRAESDVVKAPTPGTKAAKRTALDAAANVLQRAGKPMRCKEIIEAMADQSLWKSPVGKTPHATLFSSMTREIANKGSGARFKKAERGLFVFNERG